MCSLTDFIKLSKLKLTYKIEDAIVIAIDKEGIMCQYHTGYIYRIEWYEMDTYSKFKELMLIMGPKLFEKSYSCKVYDLSDGTQLIVDSTCEVSVTTRAVDTYKITSKEKSIDAQWDALNI